MKSQLPVAFKPTELLSLPIDLPPVKQKKKDRSALKAAASFARFGVQVLRIKAETLAALGKVAEAAGIRQIGHGKIMVAADNAEQAIGMLGACVEKLSQKEGEPDHRLMIDIMRLMREFNDQMIHTAKVHLEVDRKTPALPTGTNITMPFPAGAPVMIAVGKQPSPEQAESVEDEGTTT